MKYGKKGQITVFVILGIFLLFIGGLFYALYTNSSINSLDDQQRAIIESSIDSVATNVFASDCVDTALEKGILRLGKYAGSISPSNSNPSAEFSGEEYVPLITYNENIEDYPCPTSKCTYPDADLYDFGETRLNIRDTEDELLVYIGESVKECINFEDVLGILSDDFEIVVGEFNLQKSNLIMGEEKTTAVVHFPIYIETGDEPAKGTIKFSGEVNVPIKKILRMLNEGALFKETKNLDYEIDNSILSEYNIPGNLVSVKSNNYSFITI